MKLYDFRLFPNPRRARIFIAEKALEIPIEQVDALAGANRTPEFLKKNPSGGLPVLELDDGSCLAESVAICRWLEEEHPEPNLFGRSPNERAEINRWIDRLMFRLYVPTTHVFRHSHPFWANRLTQLPAWGELQRAAVLAEYDALDDWLGDRDCIVSDRFTMADIVAYTSVDFGRPSGLRVGDARPALKRWYEAVGARPSARA